MSTAPPSWAYNAADQHADRKRKHGTACKCIRCVGRDAYVAETERLKADNDRREGKK